MQRRRSTSLLEAARRYPSFPIVLEAYREVLQDYFDLPALQELLADVRARRIRSVIVDLPGPSPFASSLMFDFIASFMYDYDAPPPERRAMALTIDQALLRDLLGEPELRDLLDPEVIAAVEAELQHLAPHRRVSGADGVADLLRDLGPLGLGEIDARLDGGEAGQLVAALEHERRAIEVTIAGAARWAAVEDAARLRDALGAQPPMGVPEALLAPVEDPLGDVVGRFARTHGPFLTEQAASAVGLPPAVCAAALQRLEDRGRVTKGAFRPHGDGREWVDVDVLRRLRRRSLAMLRREVEAVEPHVFAAFTGGWHGIGSGARLDEVIGRLQGAAVPASILERDILPARLRYTPDQLDALTSAGELVWLGRGALGPRDGRIALYRRDQVPLLAWPLDPDRPDGPIHDALRSRLSARGASFFADLYEAAGGGDPAEVLAAIWDLVWAGEVTNDTLAPLRGFLRGPVRAAPGRRPRIPGSAAPPSGSGRWYLTADLLAPSSDTQRAAALAEQLLERHGVVVRDGVAAEGVPGGFSGLFGVWSALEDAGRIRRGYFVEGRGGSQFALPGALDRLRSGADIGAIALGAADPANPYGAALPWPDHDGRPSRTAGAFVVLLDGSLAAFLERGARTVLSFTQDADAVDAVAGVLSGLPVVRRASITSIDGTPAAATPLGRALKAAGFAESYRGLRRA
jgi:ATP-dependent Lhr-like helicase